MGDLDGLVVLDCSEGISGAYAAKLLGDGGATVTVIEPQDGSPLRAWSWDRDLPDGPGALFRYLRHGHRSVIAGDDSTRISNLLSGADVVITSGASILGDASSLAAGHPELVVVSVTPYGLTGPDADRPGTEFTAQAASGALAVRGTPELPPIQLGARIIEWVAGAYAGFAALASHRRQRTTGHGDLIDISLLEVANLSGSNFFDLMHSLMGRPPIERPARSVEIPSIEPTLDGWVGFNTNSRQQFDSFLLLIERPDLIEGGEWASLQARLARADEWNEMVRDFTRRHTTAEIVARAVELRVPVAPVADGPAVVDLDQVKARGVLVPDPTDTFLHPRRPWTIDGEPPPAPRPTPELGEHGSEPAPRHLPRPLPSRPVALPLSGLTVVDMTAWWAGPSSTGLLAALGADVVHVESIGRLDGIRMTGGMFASQPQWWERSSFFLQSNANKYDITLDLDTVEGREVLLRLVARADLLVENFTPRVLDAFGLGWDVVHAANPALVMVRMPAFGLDGPWRDRPGFAQTMEQVTGLAWLTGHIEDQPRIQRGPCDPNGGVHAAFAALVGLARRDRTGVGCLVEAAMFDASLAVAAEPVLEWTAYGNRITRDGNRGPAAAPQGVYACRGEEQWLALAVEDQEQWRACCEVIGRPDLGLLEDLASREGRRANHDRIDDVLRDWAARWDLAEAVDALVAAGVPASAVVDPRLASCEPQLVARGYFESVEHPIAGTHPVPGLPWRARGVDRWTRSPAPTLGQHNEEILGGWLGCSADELIALEEKQVIGSWPLGL
jgi:crotonobetainyl-CoA:carnitine CoA-transferase CaiB-like acyl-CoA transferase